MSMAHCSNDFSSFWLLERYCDRETLLDLGKRNLKKKKRTIFVCLVQRRTWLRGIIDVGEDYSFKISRSTLICTT